MTIANSKSQSCPATVAGHAAMHYGHVAEAAAHVAARFCPALRSARVDSRREHLKELARVAARPLGRMVTMSEVVGVDLIDDIAQAIYMVEGDLVNQHRATGQSLLNLAGGRLPRRGSPAFVYYASILAGPTPRGKDFLLAALAAHAEIESVGLDLDERHKVRQSALRPVLERLADLMQCTSRHRVDGTDLELAITVIAQLHDHGCVSDEEIRDLVWSLVTRD